LHLQVKDIEKKGGGERDKRKASFFSRGRKEGETGRA